ncbi:receptor-like protein EIX1 [Quercus suber]|uniref:receptor-like protein EIX1 n=1 Tax=Quercus suber TaxID=58331 RepID=UPI000CE25FEA|nr:receptor-like protein EIX1 [Quercus suber]
MTVITFTGGSSLKLLQAIVFLTLLLHLRPALGFISSVGDADSDNIRCLDGERQALPKLKKGFLDAYGNLSSWGSGDEYKNCCNWKGVHCSNQTGHVLELRLGFSYLGGMINPSLLELPYLTYLDLSYNDFNHCHIPEFIGSLGNLEYLDLSRAKLSGPIPHQLRNLSHLQYLNLSCNNLTIIENLEWLSHLFSIKDLDLSFTNLHVANDWLEVVSGGIPKFFEDICTLRELRLSGNNLDGQLVERINDLSGCAKDSLEVLELARNQFTGSLPDFAILHKLEHLDVSSNSLQGVITEAHFSNLSKLRHLQLSDNSLTLEFDFNWAPPFQLDEMYLRSCKLGPTFPNWILTQSNVTTIDISHAEISDTIPAEWFANLSPKLVLLNLSCNQIHGLLPNVSKMPLNAHTIDLNANRLEGPLPLFSTNLSSLSLSKNRFSGSLTPLCKINGGLLGFLDVSDNLLSGALPNCFMHWPNLFILNFAGNNFSDEAPSSLGLLSMLVTLSLRNNNFSGKVPAWIAEGLPQLIVLILRSDKFNGSIPWHICQLKKLRILDFSLNDISGTIPQCLNNFTAMAHKGKSSSNLFDGDYLGTDGGYVCMGIYVDSAMVVLKGREYEYGKNLGLLKIINLSSNKLSGKLPSEISSILELVVLNVSKNNLIGENLQMIGQLKQLESLDMSWNRFSGETPSSMSELQFLSHLDLSYNNLSGKIPSSTQLQGLDATRFIGNWALCGLPLTQKCPSEETPPQSEPTDE